MQEKYGFYAFILPAVLHRYACVQEFFMISIYMLFHKFVFVEFYKLILRDLSLYLYILYLVALNMFMCYSGGGNQFLYIRDFVRFFTLTICKFLSNFKFSTGFLLSWCCLNYF